uniref:Uncharacterized protein n=1 Tax=Oryza rufipogon TaxID=4529 RepID=A0A0E0N9R0_ORYRU
MEAAVFAPHQVAILELPAVEAEAAAATAPGRMAANGMSSISKGGAENSEPMELLEERDKIIELSGNGPEVERNLGRDRVRSWLSDHFLICPQFFFLEAKIIATSVCLLETYNNSQNIRIGGLEMLLYWLEIQLTFMWLLEVLYKEEGDQ